jgi:hypothetical protein
LLTTSVSPRKSIRISFVLRVESVPFARGRLVLAENVHPLITITRVWKVTRPRKGARNAFVASCVQRVISRFWDTSRTASSHCCELSTI